MTEPRPAPVPGLVLRPARREDRPRLVDLLVDDHLGRDREDPSGASADAYAWALEAMLANPWQELVAGEREGEVVATMQLTVTPSLARTGARRMQIEAVRVARGQRGRGIGHALVEHAKARARARGCRLLELTSDNSRPRAHAFYRSLGFVASHVGMKLDLGPVPPRRVVGEGLHFHAYDAFAARPGEGNVAAVARAGDLSSRALQSVAATIAAPTSVFLGPARAGAAGSPVEFAVRFFTPSQEIGLCGHASLAAAAFLVDDGDWPLDGDRVRLRAAGGVVDVWRAGPGAEGGFRLDLPAPAERPWPGGAIPTARELESELGWPGGTLDPRWRPARLDSGLRHLLLRAADARSLAALRPEASSVADLGRRLAVDTLGVFAHAGDGRAHLRDLTAPIGAAEENASGTTSAALAVHLLREGLLPGGGGEAPLEVTQAPGSARPGRLRCVVRSAGEDVTSVGVEGAALLAMDGQLWGSWSDLS